MLTESLVVLLLFAILITLMKSFFMLPGEAVMSFLNLCECFSCNELWVKEFNSPDTKLKENIPIVDNNYVFELNVLNEVLLSLTSKEHDCLYLTGPSGCGKTSLVQQIAARLGWGVEQLTLCGKSDIDDLIGHSSLRRGHLCFEYGPLVRALRFGEILLLNEIDLMPPADLAVLNDVLEGRPLTVSANLGEVIKPHRDFRVVATANSKGSGDRRGFYNGVRLQNQAFLDRWRFIEMTYPSVRAESVILKKCCTNLPEETLNRLLKLAVELRRDSNEEEITSVTSLSAPFSTRSLIRVASIFEQCSDFVEPSRIIDMGFGSRLPAVEREYVKRLCADIFGNEAFQEKCAAQEKTQTESVADKGRIKKSVRRSTKKK